MPTPQQIKSLQGISDPLIKKRYLKYFQLPQDLRGIIFSTETADKMQVVAKKNKLTDDQIWWASHTAGMILLGETNIVDFVKILKEKCKLAEELTRQLARDINQSIFLPVKESLKKIHNVPEWPRENQVEEKSIPSEPAGPKLNGNVVDLKGEDNNAIQSPTIY